MPKLPYIIHTNFITDVVEAENLREAEAIFIERWPNAKIILSYRAKYMQIRINRSHGKEKGTK